MKFLNKYIDKIYKYIYINDGQIFILTEMEKEIGITRKTIAKYLKWLERRELIKKNGKRIFILPT